jgi:hypothetical protein
MDSTANSKKKFHTKFFSSSLVCFCDVAHFELFNKKLTEKRSNLQIELQKYKK